MAYVTALKRPRNSQVLERLAGIELNGSGRVTEELREMVRGGNGAVLLDKDGVFTSIDRQIEKALKTEFKRHHDADRGIVYDFDRNLVYKLFGIDPRYNDGPTPILALMALNKATEGMGGRAANEELGRILSSPGAVRELDALIAKYTEHERRFVNDEMYWWREPDGFFRSASALSYVDTYRGPHTVTGRDAVMALLSEGIPVSIITNAPAHDLHVAGFTRNDIRRKVVQGRYIEGRILVLTRQHLGDRKKPDPYGLHYATSQMSVSIGNSVYGGDTIGDVMFAKAAGAVPVGFESGMGGEMHLRREHPELRILPDVQTLAAGLLRF